MNIKHNGNIGAGTMKFKQAYEEALQSSTGLVKSMSMQNYMPNMLSVPSDTDGSLPYVQAYARINAAFPYYYEMAGLDSYCLIYTESGMGSLIYEEKGYSLAPGTLSFIYCKGKHRVEIRQSPWNYIVFFIQGNPLPHIYSILNSVRGSLLEFIPGSSIPDMINMFYSRVSSDPGKTYHISKIILNILLELLIEKGSPSSDDSHAPDYLLKIKHDFDFKYNNNYSLDVLEQEYGISKYRICRDFLRFYSISPMKYLNYRRIEAVKDALVNTDKRINEICQLVGFDNTNSLIRLFKMKTGVTPMMFRRQPPASDYMDIPVI